MHSLRATRNININRIFFILHVRVLVSILLQVYVPVHVKISTSLMTAIEKIPRV